MNLNPSFSQKKQRRLRPALNPGLRLPVDQIKEELATARAETHDIANFRKISLAIFSRHRNLVIEAIRQFLVESKQGTKCAQLLAHLQDDLLICCEDLCGTYLVSDHGFRQPFTILAVGGYGRGTLAPFSDIDLLFLVPDKASGWVESMVEAILYLLWDLKCKVGHATRTIDECIKSAQQDYTIRTTILESRYIFGEKSLFHLLQKRFNNEVVKGSAREFSAVKLQERDARLLRNGRSRYVVEPNIKEGKGGLRDLNTLFWIAKYSFMVDDEEELVSAGLFSATELRQFQRCENFLWSVRCHLHFLANRAEERLTFDRQIPLAEKLGYISHAGLNQPERFMKHYFLVAKQVGDLTAIVCAALEEKHAKAPAVLDRFIGHFRRRHHKVQGDFTIINNRINLNRADAFQKDPVNLIRLYHMAGETGLAIHPHATRQVSQSLCLINADLRQNSEANRLFLEILCEQSAPETVLRLMNEVGILGRFIPDFGRVVGMLQFNMYHHYTVDEHLLLTVGVLSDLEAGRFVEEHPIANKILPTIGRRRVLYVAAFLHDIAKGRPQDHSVEGAIIARKLCRRFGLTAAETETVAWLIESHLVMSNTAQGRDLYDPVTIRNFANIVQTVERLKLLLVLTVCDIRAVGPKVWNGWKGQLLRTLYWEAEIILSGGHSAIDRKKQVEIKQDELRKNLPGWSDPEFDAYAQRHYSAYWLKVDLQRQIEHAGLLRLCEAEIRSFVTEFSTDAFRGVTQFTIVAPDHPRLLAIIAGACALSGANIVDAQIFTTTDGLALDTIFVSRAFEEDHDELRRAKQIATTLEKALRGEIRFTELMRTTLPKFKDRSKPFKVIPEVTVDSNHSAKYTIIEISGLDRPGLLYELTRAIAGLNLNIASSHIVTFGEKAVDAFYVSDLFGEKITSLERQSTIRSQLLEIFNSQPPLSVLDGNSKN